MATFLVGAVLIGIVIQIIRSMMHDKKKGKSLQCGGNCSNCGGHCH
ncbi:MAG: FeoB-associated Cys-rich membrane protein [Suilimivivens sp.]|mgnify:FL=1